MFGYDTSPGQRSRGRQLAKGIFERGETTASPGALIAMRLANVSADDLIGRHVAGDFGDIKGKQLAHNDQHAMSGSGAIISRYRVGNTYLKVATDERHTRTQIRTDTE